MWVPVLMLTLKLAVLQRRRRCWLVAWQQVVMVAAGRWR
jgi:hypothetical protein